MRFYHVVQGHVGSAGTRGLLPWHVARSIELALEGCTTDMDNVKAILALSYQNFLSTFVQIYIVPIQPRPNDFQNYIRLGQDLCEDTRLYTYTCVHID